MDDGIRELKERQALNVLEAVYRSAEDLLGKATRLAPVEEGTLRGSGTITLIVNGVRLEGTGGLGAARRLVQIAAKSRGRITIEAEVSFNTVYAARQHEELTWQHPKGGQARYLAEPFNANAGRYSAAIEAAGNL